MIVLGIDSSTTVATVALSSREKLLGEYSIDDKNTHSQKLMVMLESLLEQMDMDIADVDFFAVSKGPGSFTGLRIGVATAKSFAYALDKKIVGVSSLEVIAENHIHFSGIVVPMMDARNKRVFASAYIGDGRALEEALSEEAFGLLELFEKLEAIDGDILFAGDGSISYRTEIEERFGDRAVFAEKHLNTPRASALCGLAYKAYDRGNFESYFEMKPEYLRESQAEQQRKSRVQNG